jgi:hypothetical protein
MITVIMYTYREDAEIAKISLKQARKVLPNAHVIALDDAHRPMSAKDRIEIEEIGVKVRLTTHNRNGNLIGPEHTVAHAGILNEMCKQDTDIVIKIDPDTLLLNDKWIREFDADERAVLAGSFKNHLTYVIGMAYAVKGIVARDLMEDTIKFPAWVRCFEDFEVSSRIHRIVDGDERRIHRYNINGSDGWVLADHRKANVDLVKKFASVFNGGYFNKADRSAKTGMALTMKRITMCETVTPQQGAADTKQER